MEQMAELTPHDRREAYSFPGRVLRKLSVATAFRVNARRAANTRLNLFGEGPSPTYKAGVYLALGERDRALVFPLRFPSEPRTLPRVERTPNFLKLLGSRSGRLFKLVDGLDIPRIRTRHARHKIKKPHHHHESSLPSAKKKSPSDPTNPLPLSTRPLPASGV